MKVGICSVGDELVSGEVADTNAGWLAQRVREVGGGVGWQLIVGDAEEEIAAAVRWLTERCDEVIVGGGLGPTPDDRTRAAIAAVAGVGLERRDELVPLIAARFGAQMPTSNARQADLPLGAVAYEPVGTAPGFRVGVDRAGGGRCTIHVLPGVPWEFRRIAERDVLPYLLALTGRRMRVVRTVHVTGAGESSVAELLAPVEEQLEATGEAHLSYLAMPDEIRVRVTVESGSVEGALAASDPVVDEVVRRLGALAVGVDDERVEEAVARLLRATGLTVATAESCTAGLVAARLASVVGASDYLRGGVVAYATDVKADVLGVDRERLDEHGATSAATAESMAVRARLLLGADLGLGVVCVAGPAAQDGREPGTTAWALASAESARSWSRVFVGDRAAVTERAAAAVIEALRRHLVAVVAEGASR